MTDTVTIPISVTCFFTAVAILGPVLAQLFVKDSYTRKLDI